MVECFGRLSRVAHGALSKRGSLTLESDKFDRIACFAASGDGVRAVVATGAVGSSMAAGIAVQGLIKRIAGTMAGCVVTPRF
jgi:hypothetical protein